MLHGMVVAFDAEYCVIQKIGRLSSYLDTTTQGCATCCLCMGWYCGRYIREDGCMKLKHMP